MKIKGRAYTTFEKRELIIRLLNAWIESPELRLGQLLSNVFDYDTFYIEDDEFVSRVEEYVRGKL